MVSSNDVPRIFLQAMISRRVVSDKLARILWGKCVEAVKAADEDVEISYDPNNFDQYINDLNRQLEPLDLKLTVTVDEVVGKKLWAMINMKEDELAQVATDYSTAEIAYFKALIDQIMLASSESYSISSMTALREVNNLKSSMSKTQAEAVLASFVAKGWLLKSPRGRFSLSSRTLLELQSYLKANYEEDIYECTLCFELLTVGVRCYIPACSARLHNHCYKRFARDSRICPTCRADWSQPQNLLKIGEDAVQDGQDSRRTRRRNDDDETDETDETDDTEEDEPEPEPKPKKAGKAKPPKGKKRVQETADDGTDDDQEMLSYEETPAPKSQARRRRW